MVELAGLEGRNRPQSVVRNRCKHVWATCRFRKAALAHKKRNREALHKNKLAHSEKAPERIRASPTSLATPASSGASARILVGMRCGQFRVLPGTHALAKLYGASARILVGTRCGQFLVLPGTPALAKHYWRRSSFPWPLFREGSAGSLASCLGRLATVYSKQHAALREFLGRPRA